MEIKQSQLDDLINILNHSISDLKLKVRFITWIQGYQAAIVTGLTTAIIIRGFL